ncbi:hypothetical protein SE17_40620, partial [Kouleothrix aurantiaca]
EASVILDERALLNRALALAGASFGRDRISIGLVQNGHLRMLDAGGAAVAAQPAPSPAARPAVLAAALRGAPISEDRENGGALAALPLSVKGHVVGVLAVQRAHGQLAERDRWLLRSLASQLSIALENARLYHQIDGLFRQYMAPSVATTLLADPSQAALGGAMLEVSVLFADLRGFTSFSERATPAEVVAMLNQYFGIAAPLILAEAGTIDKFVGDALMALWNAPTRQPDHALRAARAALAMQ